MEQILWLILLVDIINISSTKPDLLNTYYVQDALQALKVKYSPGPLWADTNNDTNNEEMCF